MMIKVRCGACKKEVEFKVPNKPFAPIKLKCPSCGKGILVVGDVRTG